MSAHSGLLYNLGKACFGEQESVYYKQGFPISEFMLSGEFVVTPKDTFGMDVFMFTIKRNLL